MSNAISAFRQKPIPDLSVVRQLMAGARDLPIDVTDTRSPDPLIPLEATGVKGGNYYASDRNPPYNHRAPGAIDALLMRRTAAEKLSKINSLMANEGLALHVFDAWRPRAVQAYFHDVWMPQEIAKRRPELTFEQIAEEVGCYWSKPTEDPARPAPHETGGAVDLTLTWADGQPLFMGGIFDDPSPISHTDHYERETADFSFSAEEARANRRLLYWVMTEAGFANYPEEWWHFSWGDQFWARMTGAPAAFYGLAIAPK